jgi:excisionase family DNA binding protein
MQRPKRYTVKEVSVLADKTEHTIRRQIAEGVIKSVKVGGSRLVEHADLCRYLCINPESAHADSH